MTGTVAVLYGGPSAERPISLASGEAVAAALERRGYAVARIDAGHDLPEQLRRVGAARAWIALHGPFGEDGVVQGCLETMGIAYTGSGVLGSALAMDKLRAKRVWQGAGIATPAVAVLGEETPAAVGERLGWPVMVKPATSGSSLGMAQAAGPAELETAWAAARTYDDTVVAEAWVAGEEVTVAVLDGEPLPVLALKTRRGFYDYTAKYGKGAGTEYLHPTGLGAATETACQELALQAFAALGCRGWGRVDLLLGSNGPQVIEVNTVPGMTEHSLVPKAAAHTGIGFDDLVERILGSARAG